MESSRIELYKQREFGEVFNAAFAFIKQEIRPLGRAILVYILPIVLLQGILTAVLMSSMMDIVKGLSSPSSVPSFGFGFARIYLGLLFIISLTQTMVFSTISSYLKLYHQNTGEITIAALGNEIKRNFLPVFGGMLLAMLVIVVGFIFCLLPGIYLGVSLSVFLMAVVFEQNGVGNAFSRSFNLVNSQWWWTFLLLFVIVILMYVILLIFQIPSYIFGFATMFHSIQTQTNPMEAFGSIYVIYTAAISAIQQIIFIVPILLVAFQYFNLVELKEKVSLNQRINSIGENE